MKGYWNINIELGSKVVGDLDPRWVTIMQHENIYHVFEKFKTEYGEPDNIIEIGTAYGGLTYLLTQKFPNADIYSFDPNPKEGVLNLSFLTGFYYLKEDILANIENLKSIFVKSGRTLVLCDGGDKKQEFISIAPLLKPGDIIMAHDYSKSWDYFAKNIEHKIWDWCEITGEDIEETISQYNLEPYMEDDFQTVAWGCFIKNE